MTLGRLNAYCLNCTAARSFGLEYVDNYAGAMMVRTGNCTHCGSKMIRLFPQSVVPEIGTAQTRVTYKSDSNPQTYVEGRYTNVPAYDWEGNDMGVRETWVSGTYVDRPEGDPAPRGQRRHISVAELLSTVAGSVDIYGQRTDGRARWEAMIANKAAAGHFDAIVDTIAREGMRMSIVLWDRYGDGSLHIGNGHHRLVASILLGLERVPVIVSTTDDYMCVDDSSDDEGAPIERNEDATGRVLWEVIGQHLPVDQRQQRDDAAQAERLAARAAQREAERLAALISTAEARCKAAGEAALAAAQAAAGDAVWALRKAQQQRMRDAQERAVRLRAEAEAADAEAAEAEAMFTALVPLYYAACEIGAQKF